MVTIVTTELLFYIFFRMVKDAVIFIMHSILKLFNNAKILIFLAISDTPLTFANAPERLLNC